MRFLQFFLPLALFAVAASSTPRVTIHCTPRTSECRLENLTNTPACYEQILKLKANAEAVRAKALHITNSVLTTFPHILGRVFSNVASLRIENCGLRVLTGNDIAGFQQLRELIATHNRLVRVSDDLFDRATQIQHVDFSHNHIREIDVGSLIDSKRLELLELTGNACIDRVIKFDNSHEVALACKDIIANCHPRAFKPDMSKRRCFLTAWLLSEAFEEDAEEKREKQRQKEERERWERERQEKERREREDRERQQREEAERQRLKRDKEAREKREREQKALSEKHKNQYLEKYEEEVRAELEQEVFNKVVTETSAREQVIQEIVEMERARCQKVKTCGKGGDMSITLNLDIEKIREELRQTSAAATSREHVISAGGSSNSQQTQGGLDCKVCVHGFGSDSFWGSSSSSNSDHRASSSSSSSKSEFGSAFSHPMFDLSSAMASADAGSARDWAFSHAGADGAFSRGFAGGATAGKGFAVGGIASSGRDFPGSGFHHASSSSSEHKSMSSSSSSSSSKQTSSYHVRGSADESEEDETDAAQADYPFIDVNPFRRSNSNVQSSIQQASHKSASLSADKKLCTKHCSDRAKSLGKIKTVSVGMRRRRSQAKNDDDDELGSQQTDFLQATVECLSSDDCRVHYVAARKSDGRKLKSKFDDEEKEEEKLSDWPRAAEDVAEIYDKENGNGEDDEAGIEDPKEDKTNDSNERGDDETEFADDSSEKVPAKVSRKFSVKKSSPGDYFEKFERRNDELEDKGELDEDDEEKEEDDDEEEEEKRPSRRAVFGKERVFGYDMESGGDLSEHDTKLGDYPESE